MARFTITSTLIILAAMLAISCNTGTRNPQFDSFTKNFHPMDLPITIKACNIDPSKYTELPLAKYPEFLSDSDGEYVYCTFKTNGDYTGILTLGPGDCFFPILRTYDKDGNIIDEQDIVIGGCGQDCGFTCEEYMTLRADYTLYTSDTITTFKCDTSGNVIPGTKEHYVIYKTGKLLPSGKIELSDEIKQPLKD